jgi:N6-adenosine-specific RNA methylase IME4
VRGEALQRRTRSREFGVPRITVYTDFNEVPKGKYGAILADPPWHFKAWSDETGSGRSASQHYNLMSIDDIVALNVGEMAAENCALFLWVVDPMLPDALRVLEGWGFTFKTRAFSWVKTNRRSGGLFTGMGYWSRANPEDVWLGTRGSPKRLSASVHRVIMSPVREHSRKPDEICNRIENLVGGPYLELFARSERPGWDSLGNEVGKFFPEPKQTQMF